MKLHFQTSGLLTTIQDAGRSDYRAYGLPAAGAMDLRSLATANLLVGKDPYSAALELTMLGPSLTISGSGVLALAGADLTAQLNGWPLPATGSFAVSDGDRLTFRAPKRGCRSYLAAAGSWQIPQVMGSFSTYLRGSVGGFEGRALKAGDILEVASDAAPPLWLGPLPPHFAEQLLPEEHQIRLLWGPQDDYFDTHNRALFLTTKWQVSAEADRMGYRLEGETLQHIARKEVVSDGVLPGAIQVPPQGVPIVLLADAQTTGGYPKIATVISADLPLFGQLQPGDELSFVAVTEAEARQALLDEQQRQAELKAWLNQPALSSGRYLMNWGEERYQVVVYECRK